MRVTAVIIGAVSCCALTACDPAAGNRAESNLDCAALISAATYLVRDGKAENDPELMRRGLVSLMTHLNTYAIPKGMKEAEAFEEQHSRRRTFMETRPASEIMRRANRCVEQTPRV